MCYVECITTKCVRVFYVCFAGDKSSLPDGRVFRLGGLHMLLFLFACSLVVGCACSCVVVVVC